MKSDSLLKRCQAGDGAQAKQKHIEAIQLMGKLGALEKRVEALSGFLAQYATQARDAKEVYDEARARLNEFETPLREGRNAHQLAPALYDAAQQSHAEGMAMSATVKFEIREARKFLQTQSGGSADPARLAIGKELEALAQSLAGVRGIQTKRARQDGGILPAPP